MAGILAPWHWVTLAAIIAILFVGHKRIPGLGRALGQAVSAFRRAWKEGPQGPGPAKESGPKRYPLFDRASAKQDSRKPASGLLRFLLRSRRGREVVFWSLLALGVAYVALALTDGFFSTSSFRSKAIAFLVFLALGIVLLAVSWLSQRRKGKATSRVDR